MKNEVFYKKCSMSKISPIDLCMLKKCLNKFFILKNPQALENFYQKNWARTFKSLNQPISRIRIQHI